MPHVVPARLSIHVMVVVAAIGCGDVADPTQPAGFSVLEGAVDGVGRLPALPAAGTGWQGDYQMPVVDGVQKVSAFCGYLASNTSREWPQLRTRLTFP